MGAVHDQAALNAVQHAIDFGAAPGSARATAADFNASARHVQTLLADAVTAFRSESFGTGVFLAITAIEEIAKAQLMGFRMPRAAGVQAKGKDPLLNHRQKHVISVAPTTFMGRLPNLLGQDACVRLEQEAHSGVFGELRERALYVHAGAAGVTTPSMAVDRPRAREILLLALECADDHLVGWTDESFTIGSSVEKWIAEVAA